MNAKKVTHRPGAVTTLEVSVVAARITADLAGLAKQAARHDQKAIVGMVMTMVARDLNRASPGASHGDQCDVGDERGADMRPLPRCG